VSLYVVCAGIKGPSETDGGRNFPPCTIPQLCNEREHSSNLVFSRLFLHPLSVVFPSFSETKTETETGAMLTIQHQPTCQRCPARPADHPTLLQLVLIQNNISRYLEAPLSNQQRSSLTGGVGTGRVQEYVAVVISPLPRSGKRQVQAT